MKYLILTLMMLVLGVNTNAQTSNSNLLVTVSNISTTQEGTIFIGIYNNKDLFPVVGKEIKGKYVEVNGKSSITIRFDDLPTGTYAIAIFHDNNNNKKLDKNWFGVPTEGYGFSNNVFGTFGPPTFQEASFKTKTNSTTRLNIKLDY